MRVLMISGSRNETGQTARAAQALLAGVTAAGGEIESIYLPALDIQRCRQCDDNGWGQCRRAGSCVIDDDFAEIFGKAAAADALVFATPVYYSDLSESMRTFTDRLRRVCTHQAGRSQVEDTPTVGVCVAGGGGGGAPACCVSLDKVLRTAGLDVVDMLPVRRQNLEAKVAQLDLVGQWLTTMPRS